MSVNNNEVFIFIKEKKKLNHLSAQSVFSLMDNNEIQLNNGVMFLSIR
jgi:hypothetical protein